MTHFCSGEDVIFTYLGQEEECPFLQGRHFLKKEI